MRAGRCPGEVRLIAVSKNVGADVLKNAVDIGIRDFGENRLQEAGPKIASIGKAFAESKVVWHLIGHLQKNKAKTAVRLFDLIHSVDSPELAALIDRYAGETGKTQRILLQVKLSDEESKYGIVRDAVAGAVRQISLMKNLRLEGLMTVPPYIEDPEKVRPFFIELRSIRDLLRSDGYNINELSMGMSHDFEVAVEEGATMVRVGTALFGQRNKEAL